MTLRKKLDQMVTGARLDQCLAFRPFLYLTTWVAILILIVKGDFAAIPSDLKDEAAGSFWIWGGLSLWAAPTALLADYLIHRSPPCKYRAMWLRLGADVGQFISIMFYIVMRVYVGDYRVYSTAVLFAALGYVFYLVMWDINQLIGVERLAVRLERNHV